MKFDLKYISMMLAAMIAMTACVRVLDEGDVQPVPDGKGTGEMVFFSSGTTENQETKAATYYMPDTYRFVCRMYYKAQTGSERFDVAEGGTAQSAWLKVSGNYGNSLYWNMNYTPVGSNKGPGGVDDYGNDYGATAFYWQNRKEHAFLAWTDLNKATSLVGGSGKGRLDPFGYDTYEERTGQKVTDLTRTGFKLVGNNDFTAADMTALAAYVKAHYAEISVNPRQIEDLAGFTFPPFPMYMRSDNVCYTYNSVSRSDEVYDPEHPEIIVSCNWGPYIYMIWGDGPQQWQAYELQAGDEVASSPDAKGIVWVTHNSRKVAIRETVEVDESAGYDYSEVIDEETHYYKYCYWAVNSDGSHIYDFTKEPAYKVAVNSFYERKEHDVINTYKVNSFDLTRGSKTSMAQQPDIAQALTIMKPSGATQESNRVNLYFRHQFSQIQVNLKNSLDNSVAILPGDISGVQLLGVTEEGYVFTDMSETGVVHPAAYKAIDFSKYTEADLRNNPYGTSFGMFAMPEEATATGYIKSFNAIAFGQLQAIRITWREQGTSIDHVLTYRVPTTELINLQSGMKYIWNIELRRGTLAVIRADIVDWILPNDEDHNGNATGTITNNS